MLDFTLPIAFTHPIAHYTGLLLGTLISAVVSDLIVTVRSPHFGKIFVNNHFIGFWRLLGYTLLIAGLFTLLLEVLSPYIDTFMYASLNYYFGISTFVFGIFFLWFVYAFDYDIKTQWKWAFPVICFGIFILNIVVLNAKF